MLDFKNGHRESADPPKANTNLMIGYAKSMTDAEIETAADYFGSMKWTPWIKVEETKMFRRFTLPVACSSAGRHEEEPLGERIIETPDNAEATEMLRDRGPVSPRTSPSGSIKKGEALVTKDSGKTTPCGVCHGPDLKGLGPVPGIAGRSPSYLVRQLYDMQQGSRNGFWTHLMKPVVTKLTEADMLTIAAYTASREPYSTRPTA